MQHIDSPRKHEGGLPGTRGILGMLNNKWPADFVFDKKLFIIIIIIFFFFGGGGNFSLVFLSLDITLPSAFNQTSNHANRGAPREDLSKE